MYHHLKLFTIAISICFLFLVPVISADKAPSLDQASSLAMAKQFKNLMEGFYKQEYKSSIDLSQRITDRGLSFLDMNVQNSETIVKLQKASTIVNIYMNSLSQMLPSKIFAQCREILLNWQYLDMHKFVKKQILFSSQDSSSASFVSVYFKRLKNRLYIGYIFAKNAFELAPDLYVVQRVKSDSVFWGASTSKSQVDELVEVRRGFRKTDLEMLMELASANIQDFRMIQSLQQ